MSTSVHATHATGSKASATAAHALPRLPYGTGALAPVISAATVEVHYGKHHRTYVENLNRLIGALEYGDLPLETIIPNRPGGPSRLRSSTMRPRSGITTSTGAACGPRAEESRR